MFDRTTGKSIGRLLARAGAGLVAIAFCCNVALAADPDPSSPPPPDDVALGQAETLGAQIYRHDNAAAIATDEVLTLPAFKSDARVRGWVTEENPGSIAVTFVDESGAALYRVDIPNDEDSIADLMTFDTPRAPTAYEAAAAGARKLAIAASTPPCGGRYNVVTLPASPGTLDQWAVFFLPAAVDRARIPLGGAFRVDVRAGLAGPPRLFSKSCIEMDNPPEAVGLYVTHPLGPRPTEIHVFWNLWAEKPFTVGTSDGRIWKLDDGKIELLRNEGR